MPGLEVWRYEAPEGIWHWVTRDPAIIKRPGERWIAFPEDEAKALLALRAETEEPEVCEPPS